MKRSGTRKCEICNKVIIEGSPDPCLGYLPDVAHACCGHGKSSKAYCCGFDGCKPNESIMTDGFLRKGYWIKRGEEAIEWMKGL